MASAKDLLRGAWDALAARDAPLTNQLLGEAVRQHPTAHTFSSIGLMHIVRHQYEAAEKQLANAARLAPEDPEILYQYGLSIMRQNRPDEAASIYLRSLKLKPDDQRIILQSAHALYLAGDYAEAMQIYERRLPIVVNEHPLESLIARVPMWDGRPVDRLLVIQEHGLGDMIQYARFLAPARAIVGDIQTFAIPPIQQLFQDQGFGSVSVTVNPEGFDAWCAIMSLPHLLGRPSPSDAPSAPYLVAPAEKRRVWAPRLGGRAPKIGIVWHGSPTHPHDLRRSIKDLDLLRPLADCRATFFNLTMADPQALPWMKDLRRSIQDLTDTAAIIAELDLVITVDTSVAHLAGALGKPVWTLLPFHPDWRWGLGSEATPWYRTARLFRQGKPGDWGSVIARVRTELEVFAMSGAAA